MSAWGDASAFGFFDETGVSKVLSEENPTLEAIFDQDDVIQELRGLETSLITFLAGQVDQMIALIATEPPNNADASRLFRYPYLASEVLCCDISQISAALVATDETGGVPLLEKFLDFVNWSEPIPAHAATYLSKFLRMLVDKYPQAFVNAVSRAITVDWWKAAMRHARTKSLAEALAALLTLPHRLVDEYDSSMHTPGPTVAQRQSFAAPVSAEQLARLLVEAAHDGVGAAVDDQTVGVVGFMLAVIDDAATVLRSDVARAAPASLLRLQHFFPYQLLRALCADEEAGLGCARLVMAVLQTPDCSTASIDVVVTLQSELLDLCSAVSEAFPRSMLEQQPVLLDILQSRVKAADQRHAQDPRVPRRLGVAGLAAARALMAGWWLVAEKSPQRLTDAAGCGRVFGVCMEVCEAFPRNDLLHLTVCGPLLKFVHKAPTQELQSMAQGLGLLTRVRSVLQRPAADRPNYAAHFVEIAAALHRRTVDDARLKLSADSSELSTWQQFVCSDLAEVIMRQHLPMTKKRVPDARTLGGMDAVEMNVDNIDGL